MQIYRERGHEILLFRGYHLSKSAKRKRDRDRQTESGHEILLFRGLHIQTVSIMQIGGQIEGQSTEIYTHSDRERCIEPAGRFLLSISSVFFSGYKGS